MTRTSIPFCLHFLLHTQYKKEQLMNIAEVMDAAKATRNDFL